MEIVEEWRVAAIPQCLDRLGNCKDLHLFDRYWIFVSKKKKAGKCTKEENIWWYNTVRNTHLIKTDVAYPFAASRHNRNRRFQELYPGPREAINHTSQYCSAAS